MPWYDSINQTATGKNNKSASTSAVPFSKVKAGNASGLNWAQKINAYAQVQKPPEAKKISTPQTTSYPKGSIISAEEFKKTAPKQTSQSAQLLKKTPNPGFNIGQALSGIKKQVQDTLKSLPKNTPELKKEATERAKQLLKELPKAIRMGENVTRPYAMNLDDQSRDKILQFAKDAARSIPRSAITATLSATKQKEYIPKGDLEKFILGKDNIKNVTGTGQDVITGFGGSEQLANKFGLPVGFALTALDLVPGIPKKKIAEQLAKEGKEEVIKKILSQNIKGLSDDLLDDFAKRFTPQTDQKIIESQLEELGQTIAVRRKVAGVVQASEKYDTQFKQSVDDIGNALKDEHGFIEVSHGPPKNVKRAAQKVMEYEGDISKLRDLNRSTIIVNNPLGSQQGILEKIAEKFEVVRVKTPAEKGFKSTIVNVKTPHGQAEIQLVTPEMYKAKTQLGGHKLYDQIRVKQGDWVEAEKQMNTLYQEADIASEARLKSSSVTSSPSDTALMGANGLPENVLPTTSPSSSSTLTGNSSTIKNLGNPVDESINTSPPNTSPIIAQIDDEMGQLTKERESQKLGLGALDEINKSQNTPLAKESKTSEDLSQTANKPQPAQTGGEDVLNKSAENPSNKVYPDKVTSTQEAVEKVAKQTKDPPSTVKKVFKTLTDTKTKILEYVQNEAERTRQLVDRKDVKVTDASNPYQKATLYSGKVQEKINQGKKETEELIKEAKKVATEFKTDTKTVRKQINDYLYFRHAPERNAALGEKAAGITTEEAKAGLSALESSPEGAKIKALADKAQELNNKTLETLKDAGVISEELFDKLRNKYKTHVPLNRIFEESEDVGDILSGKGFDVRSTGIKRAKGSQREVDDILTNIITNYEQAVLRAEKNIVDQSTLAFARDNQDILGDLLVVTKPKPIGKSFSGGILTQKTQDPTILQLYEDGKPVWIKIKDPNLAVALRGVGREKLGGLMNAIATFTRFYSGLATRFNPEFALPNKLRDLQETAVYLSSQKDLGFSGAAKMTAKDLGQQNTKAIIDYMRGADTEGARMYKELKEMGGTTGGFGLSTKANVELNLEKLEKLANSKTRRIGDNLMSYVDNWNTVFEDSTRLSVYRQARASGASKDRAAFLAKEASINFNRMGKGGPIINALWMFSNASIQGSTKMIRSLKNPKVLGAVTLSVGTSVAAVNQWNDQVDPEWRDKVSKWDRLNSLPVVLPNPQGEGVKYISIPVSWGIKPIKVMMDYAYDAVTGKGFDAKDFAATTLTTMLEAYNPVGGSDMFSALTPTIGDIPADIARNKSWSGSKIKPDPVPGNPVPEDIRYFNSLKDTKSGEAAISITDLLQSKTGIAISPADLKYAYDSYIGGAGRSVSKTVNTITGALGQHPAPVDEYPMVSRFYRERSQEEVGAGARGQTEEIKDMLNNQSREKFKLKEKADSLYEELSQLPKEEANAKAKELKKSDPALFDKLKEAKEEKALNLSYTEKLIKQLNVDGGDRARYILNQTKNLKTKEEKNAYIKNLRTKKVISDKVLQQIKFLKENDK